ncbi:hypothetical protein JOM56_013563 [Amanita muscaria]
MDTQAQLIEPQHHFDVAHAPAHLEAEDQPHQNITLTAALCADAAAELQMERFRRQTKRTVKLDELATLYQRSDERKALPLLTHRHEISLEDSAYVTENDEAMLAWDVKSHFLDLMICVGNGLGLAAVIPNIGIHHAIEFPLDLHHRTRHFNAKYAKLGFDPKKCMMWIGRSTSGEDAWLAWVPNENTGPVAQDVAPSSGKEDTVMSEQHYRIAVMFISCMLKTINYRGITVTTQYPDVTDDTEFNFATTAM